MFTRLKLNSMFILNRSKVIVSGSIQVSLNIVNSLSCEINLWYVVKDVSTEAQSQRCYTYARLQAMAMEKLSGSARDSKGATQQQLLADQSAEALKDGKSHKTNPLLLPCASCMPRNRGHQSAIHVDTQGRSSPAKQGQQHETYIC